MTEKGIFTEADLYQKAKEIHKKIYSVDSHCDVPTYFSYGVNLGGENLLLKTNIGPAIYKKPYILKTDIPKMQEGMLDAVFMVAYLKQGNRDVKTSQKIVEKAKSIIEEIICQVESNKNLAEIAYFSEDIRRLKKEGKKAIFIGMENGYGLGKDIRNIEKLDRLGVSYITLCHNGDNDLCDSAVKSTSEHNGLSEFGKNVVKEMNRLGIMVDISHASEKTSFDVLQISEYPVIVSHAAAKFLCNHLRNISDRLMKAIAQKGGVIQVCFYSKFLKKRGKAVVKDVVNHIDYIVKTVGIDYVGIGSDFDGGGELEDLKSSVEMPLLTMELIRRGYSEEEIAKIWGGNLMRVMDRVKQSRNHLIK